MNSAKHQRRRERVVSTSSTDTIESRKPMRKKRKVGLKNHASNEPTDWQKSYTKNFACKFCSKMYKSSTGFYKHIKDNHRRIKSKHRKILSMTCLVNLPKLDNKPNITGLTNTVVLNKDKILQDKGYDGHYIVYIAQDKHSDSDSSDNIPIGNKQKKRLRLDSKSSTDTVYIGENKNPEEVNDNENVTLENKIKYESKLSDSKDTICIDDSSSDGDRGFSNHGSDKANTAIEEKKIIKDIISVCRKKYETRKKLQSCNTDDKQLGSQLKHKILSIGRKTISKNGFNNCTGLFRYLEHKNLKVTWQGKSQIQALASKEVNFVRMLIRTSNQTVPNNEHGWIDVETEKPKGSKPSTKKSVKKDSKSILNNSNSSQSQLPIVLPSPVIIQKLPEILQPSQGVQHSQIFQQTPSVQQTQIVMQSKVVPSQIMVQSPILQQKPNLQHLTTVQEPQTLHHLMDHSLFMCETKTKLLNSYPVANPKQLPKKTYANDTKPLITSNKPNVSNDSDTVKECERIEESNMIMPVIMSTQSLAEVKKDNCKSIKEAVNVTNNNDKPAPRIKVKSASELMNPTMMNIAVSQQPNAWGFNQVQSETIINQENLNSIFVPNNLVSQIQNQSAPLPSATPTHNNDPGKPEPETKKNLESIILDTVDLPNTKTDSPFKYFRNLLLLHDIILTEANAPITRDFVCLLKFKVQFKQENKNLTLCLSLFCSENKFCMSVKDGNQINIHMAKMSPNWQWEIMKVFQGDVTSKILLNAQKAGQNVYNQTKNFLCLLKSINQKQNI